jgi:hypothetical protein
MVGETQLRAKVHSIFLDLPITGPSHQDEEKEFEAVFESVVGVA